VSYQEALERNLRVMDQPALSLCRENNMPILVFNLSEDGAVVDAVEGRPVGTLVTSGESVLA
jgi:uridylate kinase